MKLLTPPSLALISALVLHFTIQTRAQETRPQIAVFTTIRDFVLSVVGRTGTPQGLKIAAQMNKIQTPVPEHVPFPCDISNTRSSSRPTSVHRLRPGDIDIVAAMGDSLTAANGAAAHNLLQVATENRGVSWSIGGQGTWREHFTLPNILKIFNPRLMGYSLSDSYTHHRESQFNVAEPGSMSRDMPYMARVLVKRIKADPRVDIKHDWKLVTLMIGGNDYCIDICYTTDENMKKSPEKHKKDLITTLDYLRDNLPRTLVNIVVSPNMKIIRAFNGTSNLCSMLHIFECPCIFGKVRQHKSDFTINIIREWQQMEEEVSLDSRYQTKNDFAVVMQPFIANLKFPLKETPQGKVTDYTFLSEDCFHFSQKGYARAANAYWNNMLQPVGKKNTNWAPLFQQFLCPTIEHPFIFTQENSGGDVNTRVIHSYS